MIEEFGQISFVICTDLAYHILKTMLLSSIQNETMVNDLFEVPCSSSWLNYSII
jgi:hypothetical protein